MSALRTLAVLLVVLAFAALEIASGLDHIERLRARRRVEIEELLALDVERSARAVGTLLDVARRQGRRLAAHPAVLGELRTGEPTADVDALAEALATVELLHSIEVVDRRGAGRRLERTAEGGIAPATPLPASERERAIAGGLADPAASGAGSAVWLATPAREPSSGQPLGHVLVGLAAGPLSSLTRGPELLPGVELVLEARDGASTDPASPPAGEDDGADASTVVVDTTVLEDPPWVLRARLPSAALERALDRVGDEHRWIIGSMVAGLVVLALVGVVVLRLSQRTFRLKETERYLRWIRRVTDRYRALMEGAADLILILEPATGSIREANAAARETLGLPAGRGLASPDGDRPVEASLLPLLVGPSAERFGAALRGAASGSAVAERELQIRAGDGRTLTVEARLALVDLGDERVVEVSLRDVTQQRDMERQLQTSERLASLGLLTAGVAHEINNPLEGVGNYLSLLGRTNLDAEKRSRYLDQARRGFDRIRDIVHDLLSFARPNVESGSADLSQVVDGALGLAGFAGEFRGVEVVREGLDRPLPVAGDPRRLEQVVLNLLLNASQAMGGRGTVRITGARLPGGGGNGTSRLVVADDGPGIPEEDLDRLFDPFFTTSARGGTGLGLSVSFGIVAAHGGTLRARNAPGGGAVFTIDLPLVAADAPAGEGER